MSRVEVLRAAYERDLGRPLTQAEVDEARKTMAWASAELADASDQLVAAATAATAAMGEFIAARAKLLHK